LRPSDWPSPPFLTHYLLENPWPLVIILLAAAVGLFIAGGRRREVRIQRFAAIPVILAIVMPFLAGWIVTAREQVAQRTRDLAEVAQTPIDTNHMGEFLRPHVEVKMLGFDKDYDRDGLLAMAERGNRRYRFSAHRITDLHVYVNRDHSDAAQSYVRMRSELGGRGQSGPGFTSWVLTSRRDDEDRWLLAGIEWIDLNGNSPSPGLLP
jgi:hypothetical protein